MDEHLLSDHEFRLFRDLIVRTTGISIPIEKRTMMRSRLQKRLRVNELGSFQEYYDLIADEGKHSPELREMINCLTASRQASLPDPTQYVEIAEQIVSKADSGRVRVWVTGCSMGQAAYSLAIAFNEVISNITGRWDVKLLASDTDMMALSRAEAGVYELELADKLPDDLHQKYLRCGVGTRIGYIKVQTAVRDMITFRQIDLAAENWPMHQNMRYDAIFVQGVKPIKEIAARLSDRLMPGGKLVTSAAVTRLHNHAAHSDDARKAA